jgi:hypothetical protein
LLYRQVDGFHFLTAIIRLETNNSSYNRYSYGPGPSSPPTELYQQLKTNDSLLFSVGFNTCTVAAFEHLIASDLEFYHDQSGVTHSKKAFLETFRKNICGNPHFKSRRELVAHSLHVFPLYEEGTLYGALQVGTHRFFETFGDAPETPGSVAQFTHLWLVTPEGWMLKRVVNYDHRSPN